MFFKIHQYDVDIQWKPGKDVVVADLLSRSYMNDNTHMTGEAEFTQINTVSFLPISEARLTDIQRESEADETLQLIKPIILQRWPEDKVKVTDSLLPYFHIRDELSVQSGLIFRGERVIIPKSMLPTSAKLLQPKSIDSEVIKNELKLDRKRQAYYYNKEARDLPVLEEGDIVRMKPFKLGVKSWKKGVINKRFSY